ncbi:hypothetical protein BGZ99_007994 [Dissophora globulifera]|uniref:Uncharacterized protein n=1 Tax=Dissophora globulifera TaxID=979702 RepID=A0A9P6RX44_9FUNG|nr:hypothetical protein BGZ99_007994 [Dissophora globulifera]
MSSSLSALRRSRPLSLSCPRTVSPSAAPVSFTHVRRASLAPFAVGPLSPPSPPLTLDQVQECKQMERQHQQKTQFQFQLQLQHRYAQVEINQKLRQQQELQLVLESDRAAFQQQQALDRWQSILETRVEYRQRQTIRKALDQEQQQAIAEHQQLEQQREHDLLFAQLSDFALPRHASRPSSSRRCRPMSMI